VDVLGIGTGLYESWSSLYQSFVTIVHGEGRPLPGSLKIGCRTPGSFFVYGVGFSIKEGFCYISTGVDTGEMFRNLTLEIPTLSASSFLLALLWRGRGPLYSTFPVHCIALATSLGFRGDVPGRLGVSCSF